MAIQKFRGNTNSSFGNEKGWLDGWTDEDTRITSTLRIHLMNFGQTAHEKKPCTSRNIGLSELK